MSSNNSENKYKVDVPANEVKEEAAKKKTFKDYYQDPDFKKRHNDYIKQSVLCNACNCYVKRYNTGHHNKSNKHKKNVEKKKIEEQKLSKDEVLDLISKLQKLL